MRITNGSTPKDFIRDDISISYKYCHQNNYIVETTNNITKISYNQ